MRRPTTTPSILLLLAGTAAACGTAPDPTPPRDDASTTMPRGDASVTPPTDGGSTPTDGGNPPTGGDGGGADTGGPSSGPAGWRRLTLPNGPGSEDHTADRVTGVLCTALDACVVVTDDSNSRSPSGAVYAATDRAVTRTLASGTTLSAAARVSGQIGFIGLSRTRRGLVARADVAGLFLASSGDPTNPASWNAVFMGAPADGTLGLNANLALQDAADGRWALITQRGHVYDATTAPGPSTVWRKLWSPTAVPPVPADFRTRHAADRTLCESDVSTAISPHATQNVYISPDLDLMMHPAGGINQAGSAPGGVCYSTDGGRTFRAIAFAGLGEERGPLAVTCIDRDRCFAYNGLYADANSAYVYRTTNASAGAGMTWTRATLPAAIAASDEAQLRHLFFAPDGMNGWIVGGLGTRSLLLRTTDGGQTWLDQTASLAGMATERLHSGFALDATHIWIGGENGALLSNDRGGQ